MARVTDELVELVVLYGFAQPVDIDLDEADFEWLENNADVALYGRTSEDVPARYWLDRGYVVEVRDHRWLSAVENRALGTLVGPLEVRRNV